MNSTEVQIVEEGILTLKELKLKYSDFIIKMRILLENHKKHIDLLDNLLKQVNVDPTALKNTSVECISNKDWKVCWEGTMRMSQVFPTVAMKLVKGDNFSISDFFYDKLLNTIGIDSISYLSTGKLAYGKYQTNLNDAYQTLLAGTSRSINDWDKITYQNTKLSVTRMINIYKLGFWDDIVKALDVQSKYISINVHKSTNLKELIDRFYLCIGVMDISVVLYNVIHALMYHYIRIGTQLAECRK